MENKEELSLGCSIVLIIVSLVIFILHCKYMESQGNKMIWSNTVMEYI